MLIFNIIVFTVTIIYLIIPFRQRGTELFYYFILIGISTPVYMISYWVFSYAPYHLQLPFKVLEVLSLLMLPRKKETPIYLILLVLLACLSVNLSREMIMLSAAVSNAVVFAILGYKLAKGLYNKAELNLGISAVMLYAVINVIKLIPHIAPTQATLINYYNASIFQILIGIFLIIFRIDSEKVMVNMKRT